MIKRNFPLLLLALVFVALSSVVFVKYPEHVVEAVEEPLVIENTDYYTGRMIMPTLDDIYVLENSAGRDLIQFENFLQGRATGLHWVAAEHFKNAKAYAKHHRKGDVKDIYVGLKMTVDSLGFMEPEILLCNTEDNDFKKLLLNHIKTFWRYPRGASGKFEVWMPIVWRADWK